MALPYISGIRTLETGMGSMGEIEENRKRLLLGVAAGIVALLIWGAWPVISRYAMQQTLDMWDIMVLRFGISGLILLPLVLRRGTGGLGWPKAVFLAATAGLFYVTLVMTGLLVAPASHAGTVIPATMMTASTIGAWLLLREPLPFSKIFGLLLIVAGIGVLAWKTLSGTGIGDISGYAWFVAGGFTWAAYTIAVKAWNGDALHTTALVSVLSIAVLLPWYIATGRADGLLNAPLDELLFQGIFQGVLVALVALLTFTQSVNLLGASRAAVFAAGVPCMATLLAWPVLGEQPGIGGAVALLLVSSGMLVVLGILRLPRGRKVAEA